MDLTLTEEQEALRRLAAEFTDREIAPYATAWDRAELVDRKIDIFLDGAKRSFEKLSGKRRS